MTFRKAVRNEVSGWPAASVIVVRGRCDVIFGAIITIITIDQSATRKSRSGLQNRGVLRVSHNDRAKSEIELRSQGVSTTGKENVSRLCSDNARVVTVATSAISVQG